MLVLVDQISQLLLWGPVPKAWTTSTAHAFCSIQSCSAPDSSNTLQPAVRSGQQLPLETPSGGFAAECLWWDTFLWAALLSMPKGGFLANSNGLVSSKSLWCVCVCMHTQLLQSCPTLWAPIDCSTRLLCPWNSSDKNTGVGCYALLQGIFPTQRSNPHLLWLLHCRMILYCWATREAPPLVWHHMNSLPSRRALTPSRSQVWGMRALPWVSV